MEFSDDILVLLTRDEILELTKMFGNEKEAFYVYTFMEIIIKWCDNEKDDTIQVTSPNNSWKNDGSIVLLMGGDFIREIFVYSLDKTLKNVREGLLKTKRIKSSDTCRFLCVHSDHIDTVRGIIDELGRKIETIHENYFYKMNIEQARSLEIKLPTEDVELRELEKEHAEQINNLWPHKFQDSEKFVKNMIRLLGGYGVFHKNDGLISWVMQGILGHINLLQTEEKFKKKGYGEFLVKVMAKHIAEKGHIPVATVIVSNTPSIKLFDKIGFEKFAKSYFIVTRIK